MKDFESSCLIRQLFVTKRNTSEGCFGARNSRSLVAMHLKINSLSFQKNLSLKVSSFCRSNTTKMTTSEAIVYIKISLIYISIFTLEATKKAARFSGSSHSSTFDLDFNLFCRSVAIKDMLCVFFPLSPPRFSPSARQQTTVVYMGVTICHV